MFDLFRSRTKAVRYVLGALLMLIAVAMVVTLIPGFGTSMGDTSGNDKVAEISGDTITVRELQRRVTEYLRRQNVPEGSRQTMAKLLVDAVVAQRSVVFQAKEMGFNVSDQDLASMIQSAFPELFPDGKFVGKDGYQALVAQREMSVPEFELGMKHKRMTDQLTGLITAGTIVTPREVEQEFRQANLKVGIEYAKLSRTDVEKTVTISDDEARAYYDKNLKDTPVLKSYNLLMLFLTEQRVAAAIPVDEPTLRKMYEARRESLMMPERVSVRHILLRTDGASKESAAKKLAEAQALIRQLRAGANFEELAKKVSEDPGSKEKGGNLGFVTRGQMVKNFEEAAFSLPPKRISEVITTEYGYHILEVLDKQAARVPSFEETAMGLRAEVQREMAFPRMQKIMDELRKELIKNPGGAENLAKATGIQAIRIDKVQPMGNYGGLGQMPELDNLLPSMKPLEVSPVINIEGGTQVVAILSGVNPQRPSTFEEMAEQSRQTAKATKVATLFKQKAETLAQKAKEYSGDLKRAAKEVGLTTKDAPEVNRDGAFEGLGGASAMPELFQKPVGTVVGPVLRDDEYVVAKITKRVEADLSQLPAQRAQLITRARERKITARGNVFEDGLVVELLRQGKIKIYENGLQRVISSF